MIVSPLWLILIIPTCTMIGYIMGGAMASSAQANKCTKCKYGDPFDEETQKQSLFDFFIKLCYNYYRKQKRNDNYES